MGDGRTRRILKRRHAAKLWGTAAAGTIIGALLGVTLDWKPIGFVLARVEDLQSLAESLGLGLPQQGSVGYQLLELASAPVAGFLLGLAFACVPWGRRMLNWLFPDPPPFLRSDLIAERKKTMTLLEELPPAFVGRDAEREVLMSFAAGSDTPFLWRAMTGPTGVGKTRLAVEWLQGLRDAGWDTGVATVGDPIPHDWQPRRPTAMVIDEAGRPWAGALGPALARLADAGRPKAPVRVLVVDVVEANTGGIELGEQRERVRAGRADTPLVLAGLGEAEFRTLWTSVAGPATTEAEVASLHKETAGRPRALLLLTRADPGTSYWQALADWAERLLPELADAPGGAAEGADRKRLKALALSALAGPLPVQAVRPALGGVFEAAPLARFFPAEALDSTLPALAPEDLAQEILLRALAFLDQPERDEITRTAFAVDPGAADRVERVLGSLWAERPECDAAVSATHGLDPDVDPPTAKRARALADLQAAFDEAHPQRVAARRQEAADIVSVTAANQVSLDDLGPALARLECVVQRRPADSEIRLLEAKAAVDAIVHYGSAGRFDDLERWGKRLIRLAEAPAFAADREIRLAEAEGAYAAFSLYGKAGLLDDLERWGERLIRLAETPAFAADHKIRLREGKGVVNAIGHYGGAGRFDDLERWGRRLISLAEAPAFAADREIRLAEAQGAFNAITVYGAAGRFDDLERWGERLIRLAEAPAFAADREIRLQEAMGAFNALSIYGRAGRFDDLERWGSRVTRAAEAFAADREIRLAEAQGVTNAMAHYGRAGRLDDLERWGDRLVRLAEAPAFAADREIRLQEAIGAFNALSDYGNAGRFGDLERWGDRLNRLAEVPAFAADRDIRLLEARAAMNATVVYRRAVRLDDLERWGERLTCLSKHPAFAADPEIRLREAKAAYNALCGYDGGGDGSLTLRGRWRNRLAAVALAFPGELGIQEVAKDAGVSYAEQTNAVMRGALDKARQSH